MANPVDILDIAEDFAATKKLLAWGERARKQGLDILADLQPSINTPDEMRRLVRYIKAGAPELRVSSTTTVPFDEPESHRAARDIMGDNFHGIAVAQSHFGAYTPEELTARMVIPFSEETLRHCAEEFFLLPTHPLDLPGVRSAHPERFSNDPDDPWFGRQDQREEWSSEKIIAPWLLVRRRVVPNSWSKDMKAQQKHMGKVLPQERLLLPVEFGYSALVHFLETYEMLCEGYVVRFAVQTGGRWVHVGWDGSRLVFSDWCAFAGGNVASGSARTS